MNVSWIICLWIFDSRSYKNYKVISNHKFREKELGLFHPKFTGIPETYGIFYAMGAALMFEGKKPLFLAEYY